jgi:DNA-directed RNA polymerase specialized sigma24 family protein
LGDDPGFWKQIADGNAEAFDALYRETAPRLKIFLRHLLANEQAAEDVVQETFAQIWRRPDRFDPERSSPRLLVRCRTKASRGVAAQTKTVG